MLFGPVHPCDAGMGLPKAAGRPQVGERVWMCLSQLTDLLLPPAQPQEALRGTVATARPLPKNP